ncbi:MAG: carbon-nitrogen hydrolase [Balneolaceae bacterium]|nr:carbon-nitrogen hydrolase [Balneolaceae bacterium]
MNTLNLALIQHPCTDDPQANLERACGLVEEAARGGARLVCLQELFHTTYFPREMDECFFEWAQPLDGPLTRRLRQLADQLDISLVAPFFERRAAGIYHNSLAVIGPGGELQGFYRKVHIPDDPGFYEKYYFTPGEEGYRVFGLDDVGEDAPRFAPLICWDQWYPEAARVSALKGAGLLLYPTAIGTLPEESGGESEEFHQAWQTIQRSHAIANGCFVASVNRVGEEGGTRFWGQSFVAGPFGQILAQAGREEEILHAELDLSAVERQRQIWPFFRDRRIDTYGPLLKRYDD